MTFADRLFWLREDLHRNGMGIMSFRAPGSPESLGVNSDMGGPSMLAQHRDHIQHLTQQAYECLEWAQNHDPGPAL